MNAPQDNSNRTPQPNGDFKPPPHRKRPGTSSQSQPTAAPTEQSEQAGITFTFSRFQIGLMVIGSVSACIVLVVLIVLIFKSKTPEIIAEKTTPEQQREPDISKQHPKLITAKTNNRPSDPKTSDKEPIANDVATKDSKAFEPTPVEDPKDPIPAVSPSSWYADIREKDHTLTLPDYIRLVTQTDFENKEIAKIFVDDPGLCRLELRTPATEKDEEPSLILEIGEQTDKRKRVWHAVRREESLITGDIVNTQIGTFELYEQSLKFKWTSLTPIREKTTVPQSLRYCLLAVTVGDNTERCRLSHPLRVDHIQWDASRKNEKLPLKVPANSIHAEERPSFRLDLDLVGQPSEPNQISEMKQDEPKSLRISTFVIKPKPAGKPKPYKKTSSPRRTNRSFFSPRNGRLGVISKPNNKSVTLGNGFKNRDIELQFRLLYDKEDGFVLACSVYVFEPVLQESNGMIVQERSEEPINIADFNSRRARHRRATGGARKELKREQDKLIKKLDKLDGLEQNLEQGRVNANLAVERSRKAIAISNEKIEKCQRQIEYGESCVEWYNRMEDNLSSISKITNINYTLYREIEGQRVELVRSNLKKLKKPKQKQRKK